MEENEGGKELPEGCIASIIARTTPLDACRLAIISSEFRSASYSNDVWEHLLPSDIGSIVSRSDGGRELLEQYRYRKKELYMRLSNSQHPLLIDDVRKCFWLERHTGKKCWMIGSRSLDIAWDATPMYWRWTSIPESKFRQVAELLSVCWLHITGRIHYSMLSPETQYSAYMVFKLTEDNYGLNVAIASSMHSIGSQYEAQDIYLIPQNDELQEETGAMDDQFPTLRDDGWLEVKIGEYYTHPWEEDDVTLLVREVTTLNWKKGLILEGFEVRPTGEE